MPVTMRRRDVQTDGPTDHSDFDDLAKGLGSGTMSRKGAITLLGATVLGAVVPVPWLSRLASAQEGGTTCAHMSQTGLCPTIDETRPFQPCCVDTSTTTPGTQTSSDCSCM